MRDARRLRSWGRGGGAQRQEMKPVIGSRCVVMHITPEDAKQVTVVFAGQTWNFRTALDSEGFQAAKIEEGDSVKYFRVLKHHDVSEEPKKIESLLGTVLSQPRHEVGYRHASTSRQ